MQRHKLGQIRREMLNEGDPLSPDHLRCQTLQICVLQGIHYFMYGLVLEQILEGFPLIVPSV